MPLAAPLLVLVSPSVYDTIGPYRSVLERHDVALGSFGVERPQAAVINPECFRHFQRGDGWVARFTMPVPGALVTFIDPEGNDGEF